jgi:hypothetical protein
MRDWLNRTRLQRPVWPHRTSDLRLKLGDIRVRHHLGAVRCQFALPVSYRRRRLGNPCAAKSGKCGPADVICHDRPIRPDDVTASATPLRGRLAHKVIRRRRLVATARPLIESIPHLSRQ